jgi:DNA-directed RNA polymerase omega subunit
MAKKKQPKKKPKKRAKKQPKKQPKKRRVEEVPAGLKPPDIDPEIPVEQQVPLNELPTHFANSYEIVVAAARRARQINLGLRPLVNTKMNRPVDVALAELAAGKIEYSSGDEETDSKG